MKIRKLKNKINNMRRNLSYLKDNQANSDNSSMIIQGIRIIRKSIKEIAIILSQ